MSGSANYHAVKSPSGADRWIPCTASIDYVARLRKAGKLPQHEASNKFGLSGTYMHDCAELALNHLLGVEQCDEIAKFKNVEAWSFTLNSPEKVNAWLDSRDDVEEDDRPDIFKLMIESDYSLIVDYIDYCMAAIRSKKDAVYVEVRSQLFYETDHREKGTCDFLVLHDDGDVTIVDLKWRRSGMVESEKNTQLSIYCMSFIEEYRPIMGSRFNDDTKISLTTFNPLVAPHVDPWETTLGELDTFCDHIREASEIIDEGLVTVFTPTKKGCQWCPARDICNARKMQVGFSMPDNGDVDSMTDEDALQFYKAFPQLKEMHKNIEDRFTAAAERGAPVPGTKLVDKVARRKYHDKHQARELLKKYLKVAEIDQEPDIIAFGTIIKKLKAEGVSKEVIAEFEKTQLVKPKAGTKLALSDDSRPAIKKVKDALFSR